MSLFVFCLLWISSSPARAQSADPQIQTLDLKILEHPNDPVPHNQLGIIYANAGQWKQALYQLSLAANLAPSDVHYQLNLASTMAGSGNLNGAERAYLAAIKLDPENVAGALGLADVDRSLGKDQAAVSQYLTAESLDPMNLTVHEDLASEYLAGGNFAGAQLECQYALCIRPNDVPTMEFLATSMTQLGKIQEASSELETALALPNIPPAQLSSLDVLLGSLLMQQGHNPDAIAALKHAVSLTPNDPEAHNALGVAFWATGDKKDADTEWKVALSSHDPNAKQAALAWLSTP